MEFRKRMMMAVAMLAAVFVGGAALAAPNAEPRTHEGKVVSLTAIKLVMTGKGGDEHSHALTPETNFTLDGKVCLAADIKPGTRIRVSMLGDSPATVHHVAAIEKKRDFADRHHVGKVISMTGDKLVMASTKGKDEHTCTLTSDVKITCDGKVCKSTDLKPGMRIRVTIESDDSNSASRIEALDKNRDFKNL